MFTTEFDNYVCAGDTIETDTGRFTVTARIEYDSDYHIDDDDCHNTDQSVTECDNEQFQKLMDARKAWKNGEWWYGGVVLSVARNGVVLDEHAASVWGIEINYPNGDNTYLLEVANEMLDEAIQRGDEVLDLLK